LVFVDESGDPGLTSQAGLAKAPYFVFGFVFCRDASELRRRLRRFLKRAHVRKRYPGLLAELKFNIPRRALRQRGYSAEELEHFSRCLPLVRDGALRIVQAHTTYTFAAVIDKRRAAPTWTGERLGNFVFAQTLMVNVLAHPAVVSAPSVVHDKGRLSPANSSKFRRYLQEKEAYFGSKGYKRYAGNLMSIESASESEPGLWAADLLAGAFNLKFSRGEGACVSILPECGTRVYWEKK
jgi:hypothetical protein